MESQFQMQAHINSINSFPSVAGLTHKGDEICKNVGATHLKSILAFETQ
jgi:hypothetical protein